MAIREIRVVPDPVLRTPCDPIKEITPAVRHLVQDLLDTVDDPGRAGLSANQIGVNLRAFSYNIDGKIGYVLNPVLEETSGEQYGDEGCLSVPGLWYKTRRADYARVRGIDLDGNPVVLEGHGIMGRMLQHETDHLDGHAIHAQSPSVGFRSGKKLGITPVDRVWQGPVRKRRDPVVSSYFVCHPARSAVASASDQPLSSTGMQQIRVMFATTCVGRPRLQGEVARRDA